MPCSMIAVVEDELLIAGLLREALTDQGYQVLVAADTASAHCLIWEQQPDLVILDIRLEHPTAGWQLLQAMRACATTAQIPVLVCSADIFFIADQYGQICRAWTDVLTKPFDLEALLMKVKVLLSSAH